MQTIPVFDFKATDLELLELLVQAVELLLKENPDPQEKTRLYGRLAFYQMKRALQLQEEQHGRN